MKLVIGENAAYHVSLETVKDFERAILKDEEVSIWAKNKVRKQASKKLISGLYKVSPNAVHRLVSESGKRKKPGHEAFVVIMGDQFSKCWPAFQNASKRHVYLFDAWPSRHEKIKRFVNNYEINTLFVSSAQVADLLCIKGISCAVHHVPEGIRKNKFDALPWEEKDLDVLHMGRRFEPFHQQVALPLKMGGYSYAYESHPGALIFKTEKDFELGMARSKISICVPSGITHPERTGGIQTMTQRYLQTMLSKSIPLGVCPPELIDVFGYDPVVPFDQNNPVDQIKYILSNWENYAGLLDRNYETVRANHTWEDRWSQIIRLLKRSDEGH